MSNHKRHISSDRRPPKSADRFLSWFLKGKLLEEILGDLHEYHDEELQDLPKWKRKLFYWFHVFNFLRPFALKRIALLHLNFNGMYRNHFKIAFRTSLRHKGYSFINVLGLALGLASFILAALYVNNELSYDRFHKGFDRIYRVVVDVDRESYSSRQKNTPGALRQALLVEVPEIEEVTHLHPTYWGKLLLWNDNFKYYETGIIYADSSFFDVFSFQLIQGNPRTALTGSASVVLTESLAEKFFGDEEAMGKTLKFGGKNRPILVTGIVKDPPRHSHIQFDLLFARDVNRQNWAANWGSDRQMNTYIKVKEHANLSDVDTKIQRITDEYGIKWGEEKQTYYTQPLAGMEGIHMGEPRRGELTPSGNRLYIQVLIVIGFFMLFIAGVNYINLATARSALRAKEIGIRKVTGALRRSLVYQFLSESMLLSFVAGILAIGLTALVLPYFNQLIQVKLVMFDPGNKLIWVSILPLVLGFGILAGIYPAFYLSSVKPVVAFKKQLGSEKRGVSLRKFLVVAQFALSAFLVVGMIVVQQQMTYMRSAELGFDKDQVLVIQNFNKTPKRDVNYIIRRELEKLPGVERVGASLESMIGTRGTATGILQLDAHSPKIPSLAQLVDIGYLDVLGLKFTEGSNFSLDRPKELKNGIILNEAAVNGLGIERPAVGKKIADWTGKGEHTIIGVVDDFHASSLHHEILPYRFSYNAMAWNAVIKLKGGSIAETMKEIDRVWKQFVPVAPMDYYFLDDRIDQTYQSEMNFRTLFSIMTGLALFIAALGLLGLVAFMTERRTKEIGIRKVLGASVSGLISLLSREFLILVFIANLIAWPLAFMVMREWLENFAYRITINWSTFLWSALVAFAVALIAVSVHTYKSAIANPINALRDE